MEHSELESENKTKLSAVLCYTTYDRLASSFKHVLYQYRSL